MQLTATERRLRRRLLDLAGKLPGKPEELTKEQIRDLHAGKRIAVMTSMNGAFDHYLGLLRKNLAVPSEISIARITPQLTLVKSESPESDLFNAASLLWSIPVSKGFGRRMRYLVTDSSNGKLIGIIGLTDPVFNLTPRDAWVGWTSRDRGQRLIHVMDAFVLGAMPPYSKLLAGKLVALLATSCQVVDAFRRKYRTYEGIISESKKDPHLVLITTSSALGRSSIYNRLRIPDSTEYLTDVENDRVPTWYTQGYGHFHIPEEVFADLQQVLVRRDHPYAKGNRFGDGPNWRIRVIRQATVELGIATEVLQHGVRRQVYVVPLARNTRDILLGTAKHPHYITESVSDITEFWRTRWAIPRAERFPEWLRWNSGGTVAYLNRLHAQATPEDT